jgi:hypothetical protein
MDTATLKHYLANVGLEVIEEDTWTITFRQFATNNVFSLSDEQIAALHEYSTRDEVVEEEPLTIVSSLSGAQQEYIV